MSREKYPHYYKYCPYEYIDVYRVLELFGVTDQAIGHAIKKLLVAGNRGQKNFEKDISEAIATLNRKLEMLEEGKPTITFNDGAKVEPQEWFNDIKKQVDNNQESCYTKIGPSDSFGPLPKPVRELPVLTEEEMENIYNYMRDNWS